MIRRILRVTEIDRRLAVETRARTEDTIWLRRELGLHVATVPLPYPCVLCDATHGRELARVSRSIYVPETGTFTAAPRTQVRDVRQRAARAGGRRVHRGAVVVSARPNLHAFFTRSTRPAPAAPPPPSVPETPRRKPPVIATRLTAPVALRREATADTCACGHTYASNPAVWCELVGGRVVAYCPSCSALPRPATLRGGR